MHHFAIGLSAMNLGKCDRLSSKLWHVRTCLEYIGALAMLRAEGPYPSSSNTSRS
jgi:hypothetical protein